MHFIRRFNGRHSRRHFLATLSRGAIAAGVLSPLWPAIARSGDTDGVYPDELLSLDMYTGGKIAAGDTISADNVEYVRDLLDDIKYQQIAGMGRRLQVAPTTTDIMQLSPRDYIEATTRNQGMARFDNSGNVVNVDGQPWIGGNPFPEARTGLELFASLTLSWGRHDASLYAIKEYDLSRDGDLEYEYETAWAELATVARVSLDERPYWLGHEDKLRYQSIVFTSPQDVSGTSYLNTWYYDQNRFPELIGYLPNFKRIRTFPTNQRFEPLVPGGTLYLSDAWAAGDPLHTWSNYRIVDRGPFLAAVSDGWNPKHSNWEHSTHGGPKGTTFWDTTVQLIPEAIVVEAEPTSFKRAPVSKKRVWFDARTGLPLAMNTYDHKGEVYRSFDGAFSVYRAGDHSFMDGSYPYWSWTHLHAFDIQTGRMSRLEQVKEISGGHRTSVNDEGIYQRYLTRNALKRLGH